MLISLKFIISDRLPKIAYFSVLDYYITFTYIIMVALILHVCTNSKDEVRSNYFKIPSAREPDMLALVSAVWIGVHVVVLYYYQSANNWEFWNNFLQHFGTRKLE